MASAARLALRAACAAATLFAALPERIHAETLPGVETPRAGLADADAHVIAYGTVELAGADGERAWQDGGFGKGRYGGGRTGDFRIRPRPTEAGVVLQPRFGWALGATIVGIAQAGQDHPLDVSEAFLTWRPLPIGGLKFQVRAGLFWPDVSLEHGRPEWAVRDSLTPSAINSWIGEEVKVAGVETSAAAVIAGQRLTITAALFGDNDTAGTLIAFRGWALHDEKATLLGAQPLPPRNIFMTLVQAPVTYPAISLSPRVGYYVKLAWRPPLPIELQYFHYDNRANPQAVTPDLQWGWRTRFDHLALIVDPSPTLRLTAQAISGRTRMGFPVGDVPWVDTRFRSAYAMATRSWRRGSLSLRGEAFDTTNHGSRLGGFDDEHGWAATLAARRQVTGYASLLAELVHIDSDRQSRLRLAETPRQTQTIARIALRVRFKR